MEGSGRGGRSWQGEEHRGQQLWGPSFGRVGAVDGRDGGQGGQGQGRRAERESGRVASLVGQAGYRTMV